MPRSTPDMFSQFEHIRERMEQAYQRLLGAPGSPHFCVPFMEPPVDVYETDGEVVILMEIAGISEEAVSLEVQGNSLVIEGERKPLSGHPHRVYSQMEIGHGPFRRELLLPADVDPQRAQAEYKDGILRIVLPKTTPAVSRHLRIVVH
jgi:HSP20 family protein